MQCLAIIVFVKTFMLTIRELLVYIRLSLETACYYFETFASISSKLVYSTLNA